MQYQHIGHRIKGFYHIAKYATRYLAMVSEFDTIQRIIEGKRRYILTFVDLYSRFSFAWACGSPSSRAASHFLQLVSAIFPYAIENVLTDNGSEFKKHFEQSLSQQQTHWLTYPKTPKMNAHCERFNRTLQEEFVDYHRIDLIDLYKFNQKLFDYLFWFNGFRPHFALQCKSPVQFLLDQPNHQCNMWWPDRVFQ
jgi:transposase InsO family protein